jgi:hypothetical protein
MIDERTKIHAELIRRRMAHHSETVLAILRVLPDDVLVAKDKAHHVQQVAQLTPVRDTTLMKINLIKLSLRPRKARGRILGIRVR